MKYRIRPYGFTTRDGKKVPEYIVERAERDWIFLFPVTEWRTVDWTTEPSSFEEIIKKDTLHRSRAEEHNAVPVRHAQTTLCLRGPYDAAVRDGASPYYVAVDHLEDR